MQKLKLPLLLALAFSVVLAACLKDTLINPVEMATVSFAGKVIDENGQPLSGALVRAGGEAVTTDNNGIFRLKQAQLEARDAKLFVSKIGYFDFSRAYFVNNGSSQNLTVQLIKKEQIAAINAAVGGLVEVPGGVKLVFPANAVMEPGGQPYSGTVRIYAHYLDPGDPNLNQYMPGDLRGIDAQGQERALVTYGMVGVELESAGGQPLQIATDHQVELRMPVAPGQKAKAPKQIPLWHYDLNRARWIEEGAVTRQGDEFVGKVAHFSFWNVDAPFNLVEISGKVYLGDSTTVFAGAKIKLTMLSDSSMAFALTDGNGFYKGGVPQNETFNLDILDACGDVLFSMSIGPFSQDEMLPPIIVPNAGSNQVNISGTLMDCDSMPVSNGYVKVNMGNITLTAFTDITGAFSLKTVRCDTSSVMGEAVGFDLNNMRQSAVQTFNVPPDSVSLGNLGACDSLQEYIIYTLDNQDYVKVDPSAGVLDSFGVYTFISALNGQDGIALSFKNGNQTGAFPLTNFWAGQINVSQPPVGLTTTVTTAPANVGDVLEGEFSGTFLDFFGVAHTVTGTYRVVRDW